MQTKNISGTNPIIYSDFPDPDIIRIDDTYYMASTTMHYMPGCDILRSYDLINWELLDQVYDKLEENQRHMLEADQNIYGEGMWAPTLRYNDGKFYLLFSANDTKKNYLFIAKSAEGPWVRQDIEGFYYDSSLFFDDDGRVYIVHGQTTLYLTELMPDLSGPKPEGLKRIIAVDEERINLGFEGSHMYKRNGKYYVFTCHALAYGTNRKTQDCFVADSLTGEFVGKCIIDDDMDYHNLGVAQGGMIDTPDGDWYLFMFHDRGALGRAPMLMPMHFEDDFPALGNGGKVPMTVQTASTREGYVYEPINGDDDFTYQPDEEGTVHLKRWWQFNHVPHNELWSVTERPGAYRLHTEKVCSSIMQAYNTLTQRMTGPECAGEVTVDGSRMKDGDVAGLSAFQGCYGMIALTKENGQYYLVMMGKPAKNETIFGDFEYENPGVEYGRIPVEDSVVQLRVEADFTYRKDEAEFFYKDGKDWKKLGITQKLYFKMDHFTGCRFGLSYYSTTQTGGIADFLDFHYYADRKK